VEKRQREITRIMDQLAIRERTAETEQMLRIARQAEGLWCDISGWIGANDILILTRKAA
jgi:hypothetical protein